ncbi:unnamed protein product [Rhizopus stolonifer]
MNKESERASSLSSFIQVKCQEIKALEPLKVELPLNIDSEKDPVLSSRKVLKPTTNMDRAYPIQVETFQQQKRTTSNTAKYKKKRPSSNLVNDQLVPAIIRDENCNIKYIKNECVGLGGFAKVYRVVNEKRKEYAVKVIAKASLLDSKRKEKLIAEINIHRSLCHEYIVQYQSCFEDKYNVYIILEYCRNQTLNTLLTRRRKITEDEVRYFMGQLLSAVRYISDNRIVHRDIKLGNVFLDENMDCKIGDFGLSARLVNKFDRRKTTCGTPHYIAPEILFDTTGHNHRADMWSAGVLMYTLLFGKHPFHHDERKKLYQIVKQNGDSSTFSFPKEDTNVSSDAKHLISSLLVNNPDLRLTVTQALNHSFFVAHSIPERMPKTALYKKPSHRDLYPSEYTNTSSQSKVADSVRQAGDANENYVDRSIKPPLQLLQEVILDHRTHFPIRAQEEIPQISSIPQANIPNSSPKSNSDYMTISPKRIQKETNIKDQESKDEIAERIETREVLKEKTTIATQNKKSPSITNQQMKKPIMEEMAENLKIMLDRKETKGVLKENEMEGYRGRRKLGWENGNAFVISWLDATKTYGFCYSLSDGTLGVLYPDRSTLTTHDEEYFFYSYQQENTNDYMDTIYTLDNMPDDIKKKRYILNQFKLYMKSHLAVEYSSPKATQPTGIYVMKYAVDQSAISFKLSNGVIQFNFFNHKKLIMHDGGTRLIYIDENKKLSHHHTIDVLYSENHSIIECIKNAYQTIWSQNELRQEALRTERWKRYQKLNYVAQ